MGSGWRTLAGTRLRLAVAGLCARAIWRYGRIEIQVQPRLGPVDPEGLRRHGALRYGGPMLRPGCQPTGSRLQG